MKNQVPLFALFGVVCVLIACIGVSATSLKQSPTSGRVLNVTYDHRALLINGQRKVLISGSIHYPRSTPKMWPSILKRTKAGGVDIVETYLFWNSHEPRKGEYDFSGNLDVLRFLRECQKAGLYVHLRIGPYVCAEWNYGGFPEWLKEIPGIEYRTMNEPFLNEMTTWVTYVVDLMKKNNMFAWQGGPIILSQIENEYGNWEWAYGEGGKRYVQWAAKFALSLNVSVPWIMCQQADAPDPIINTCNGYYCDGFTANSPTKPSFWTENWPGWFQKWSEPVPHRPVEDIAFAVARFFARGGSMMNYYMYHGGTNFGRTVGGPFIITSYDYDVALDEFGLPSEPKYSHSALLHYYLKEFESALMGAEKVPDALPLGKNVEAHIYGTPGESSCRGFISNIDNSSDARVTFNGRTYNVPAWSVTLLGEGCKDQVMNTAELTVQSVTKGYTPSKRSNRLKALTWFPETIGQWGSSSQESSPPEQITYTHDETDYLWYVRSVNHQGGRVKLSFDNVNDYVYVYVNGMLADRSMGGNTSLNVDLVSGNNELSILVMTMGLKNYDDFLENYTRGIVGRVYLDGQDITRGDWTVQKGLRVLDGVAVYEGNNFKNVAWKSDLNRAINRPMSWFKGFFDAPAGDKPVALDLKGMGKGAVFVNGYHLGRYWPTSLALDGTCDVCDYRGAYTADRCRTGCNEPAQRYYHVPREWLRATGNMIMLLEEVGGDPRQIQVVERAASTLCNSVSENYPADDSVLYLQCEQGQNIVAIDFASYGTPSGDCRNSFAIGSCHASNSKYIVHRMCLNKNSCKVPVTNQLFSDPCPNVSKKLSVSVRCA